MGTENTGFINILKTDKYKISQKGSLDSAPKPLFLSYGKPSKTGRASQDQDLPKKLHIQVKNKDDPNLKVFYKKAKLLPSPTSFPPLQPNLFKSDALHVNFHSEEMAKIVSRYRQHKNTL